MLPLNSLPLDSNMRVVGAATELRDVVSWVVEDRYGRIQLLLRRFARTRPVCRAVRIGCRVSHVRVLMLPFAVDAVLPLELCRGWCRSVTTITAVTSTPSSHCGWSNSLLCL